jgi:hypothetical protein
MFVSQNKVTGNRSEARRRKEEPRSIRINEMKAAFSNIDERSDFSNSIGCSEISLGSSVIFSRFFHVITKELILVTPFLTVSLGHIEERRSEFGDKWRKGPHDTLLVTFGCVTDWTPEKSAFRDLRARRDTMSRWYGIFTLVPFEVP